MMVEMVNAAEFWRAMCRVGFVRASMLTGRIGDRVIVTLEPPEWRNGMVATRIDDITAALRLPRIPRP